jgi:hypothetical protein
VAPEPKACSTSTFLTKLQHIRGPKGVLDVHVALGHFLRKMPKMLLATGGNERLPGAMTPPNTLKNVINEMIRNSPTNDLQIA